MSFKRVFDEEANIKWAQELEDAGVKVIFGVPGLKVHSKLCLVSRKEDGKTVHYAAISTGNFNESTAKVYTDQILFTAHKQLTDEVNRVFHFYDNNYKVYPFKHLIVSPFQMREQFVGMINQEIKNAKAGEEAWIIFKLNNLVDFEIIKRLYAASKAGVKVQLLCRGVCSLVPGVERMSENIEGYSVVDKFLEHSRIYVFANGGKPKYFLSSADLMTRNIDMRVEVTAPIYSNEIKREIWDMLQIQLKDNVKTRVLDPAQSNEYLSNKKDPIRSQIAFYDYLKARLK